MISKTRFYLKVILKNPISILVFLIINNLKKRHFKIQKLILQKNYDIHPSVKFWENTKIYGSGKISIGEGTYFGRETFVCSHPKGSNIKIGKRCAIAHGVNIRTGGYDVNAFNTDKRTYVFSDIIIGDDVWIGSNVFIKGGVTIGSNVAIGANSVITKNIPDNTVYAGIPAKFIKDIKV